MTRQSILLTFGAIIAVSVALSWYVATRWQEISQNSVEATTTPSGKIDEHLTIENTLRDVNFCGTIYRAKMVTIDGVDVLQRIAESATERKMVPSFPLYKGTAEICRKISQTATEHSILTIDTGSPGPIEGGEIVYPINIMGISFIVNLSANDIAEVGGPEFPDPGNFGVFIPVANL
jgi:hypothetical protein